MGESPLKMKRKNDSISAYKKLGGADIPGVPKTQN
jgi:hypothetical protein